MEIEEYDSPQLISLCEPSPSQSPIGRVMSVLLAARHRHLDAALRRLGVAPSRSASGSLLDESLCFLWRHVEGAVEKGECLDEVLVPMMEHSSLLREPKHSKQIMALVGWLFKDERFAHTILSHLVEILKKKEDHYVALGWCKFVIMLVNVLFNLNFENGKHEQVAWLKILWHSVSDLSYIICNESICNDGFELPTRLAVASADCMLVLFEALMRFSAFSASVRTGKMITDLKSENQQVLSEFSPKNEKSHKSIQSQSHYPVNMEIGCILWDSLDVLIILIEKLKAWSKKSQPLHSKGLEQLCKWVQGTKLHYDSLKEEAMKC